MLVTLLPNSFRYFDFLRSPNYVFEKVSALKHALPYLYEKLSGVSSLWPKIVDKTWDHSLLETLSTSNKLTPVQLTYFNQALQ